MRIRRLLPGLRHGSVVVSRLGCRSMNSISSGAITCWPNVIDVPIRRVPFLFHPVVATDTYLSNNGSPTHPNELSKHQCLIYSTVQGDDVWHIRTPKGDQVAAHVTGKLKSNNLSILLSAVHAGLGIVLLRSYAAAAGRTTCYRTRRSMPFSRHRVLYLARCLRSRYTCSSTLRASGGKTHSFDPQLRVPALRNSHDAFMAGIVGIATSGVPPNARDK